mmetsp:Transcript_30723/g.67282  ORF Transcript_30723/g.67282 Transcript_30723/m.67282 type:complete len:236 (-) Transcript_30723:1340-2047(-)
MWAATMATGGALGIALSGGGVLALLAGLCQLEALDQVLQLSQRPLVAATSGALLAAVLRDNKNLTYPPHWVPRHYNSTAHMILSERFGSSRSPWFAQIQRLLDPLSVDRTPHNESAELGNIFTDGRWWEMLLGLATETYGVQPSHLHSVRRLIGTLTLLRATSLPVALQPSDNVWPESGKSLLMTEFDAESQILQQKYPVIVVKMSTRWTRQRARTFRGRNGSGRSDLLYFLGLL